MKGLESGVLESEVWLEVISELATETPQAQRYEK
jgi:hypothetical protein